EVTLKLYRTCDLNEAAALCCLGYSLHAIEGPATAQAASARAVFVITYAPERTDEFAKAVRAYADGTLLVPPRAFSQQRAHIVARLRARHKSPE
ncbi:MAG: hypothetical protein ACE5O2_17060, partial [Armatimonadota bacterium]